MISGNSVVGPTLAIPLTLTPANLRSPPVDKTGAETAVQKYLRNLGQRPRPTHWFADARSAYAYVYQHNEDNPCARYGYGRPHLYTDAPHRFVTDASTARLLDAVWFTVREAASPDFGENPLMASDWNRASGEAAVWSEFRRLASQARGEPPPRMPDADTLEFMTHAFAAGLFLYWLRYQEVICVPLPSVWAADEGLHREDGPVIAWPSGERHWLWRGVRVPQWMIEHPQRITPARIRGERNLEIRRCMIERFGLERFVRESGAELIAEDRSGTLWRINFGDRHRHTMVEVADGTVQHDGTRRRYFLRVPPRMRSAREAVAWTYGLTPQQYDLAVRT
jgi:hypothetical protein